MKRLSYVPFLCSLVGVLALSTQPAKSQDQAIWDVDLGPYSDTANWNHPFGDFLPDYEFDEVALIGNGGTAFVEDTPDPSPAAITINGGSTLEIRSGGNLTIRDGVLDLTPGVANGETIVTNGQLVVLGGGSFTAESLNSGGAGMVDLSGTANMTINGASQLAGTTRIAGPDVSFSTDSLVSTGTINAAISGASHSAIDVSGAATLSGTLALEFGEGIVPAFGDSWDIVEAQSISGGFDNLTSNVSPGPGFVFGSQVVAAGNRQIAEAVLEPRLTLEVNRQTGQVQIRDLAGIQATTIDGYFIGSPGGTLDSGEWNQLGDADWIPSDAGVTHVGEATLDGQMEIAANGSVDLGNFYANSARSTEFGLAVEDITFQYSLKSGEVFDGLIDYTDAHNNLVLVVDPETGDTWIQNQSLFDITIDGYEIESVAGALEPTEWQSFASSNTGWTEGNPFENHVGEVSLSGSRQLEAEGDPISLGSIFTPGAEQDLLFRFNTTAGNGGTPMTLLGIVEYDDGPIEFAPDDGVDGDYNGNGRVEQGDLDLVLLNWGQPFDTLPETWVHQRPGMGIVDQAELDGVLLNWGSVGQGLTAAAVPEPGGCCILAILGVVAAISRSRARFGFR